MIDPIYPPASAFEVTHSTNQETGIDTTTISLRDEHYRDWLSNTAKCSLLDAIKKRILVLPPEIRTLSSVLP